MSSPRVAKGLNANLENFELTDVMQLITQQVKCGVLNVEGSNGSCSWSFNEGSLVDFDCNFPGHVLDLKNILQQSGIINDKSLILLHETENLSSAHALEKALVKNNFCNREELEKTNLRRLIESFIITLQWTKGRYKFIPTSEVKNHAFLAPQDANFIILEALRQIDEMAVMKKRLQPLERIYESTLALTRDESLGVEDNLFQEGLKDQFDLDEFEVYKLLDGRRSLNEILESSITGQFHTCCTILDFLDRNIIAPISVDSRKPFERGRNRNLSGIALLILSCALLISTYLAINPINNSKVTGNPTLFSAIIENLKADQQKLQQQTRKLLQINNTYEDRELKGSLVDDGKL